MASSVLSVGTLVWRGSAPDFALDLTPRVADFGPGFFCTYYPIKSHPPPGFSHFLFGTQNMFHTGNIFRRARISGGLRVVSALFPCCTQNFGGVARLNPTPGGGFGPLWCDHVPVLGCVLAGLGRFGLLLGTTC